MSLRAFFEHFDLLADAPGAVARLRELILQLAVQGKLVPQDPNDEPASALLERVVASRGEKQQKFALETRTEQTLADLSDLPDQWVWTTLSDLGSINPRNKIDDNLAVSFIPMPLIPAKYGEIVQTEIRIWKDIKKGYTHFAEGDIVLAKITPCFQNRKSTVMRDLKNGFGAGTTEIHVFRPIDGTLYPNYVLIYLKSPLFVNNGISKMTGTAGQQRVPTDYFAFSPFPLPPLAEQRRIVAKVDELMVLCDELERQQEQRRAERLQLNASSLDALLAAGDPEELAAAWQRVVDAFDLLYDTPETVGKLRQTILQLAVQGRLVPQDPADEPASSLLVEICTRRDQLVMEKKIKKSYALNPILRANEPFSIPANWNWVYFQDVAGIASNLVPPKDYPNLPHIAPDNIEKFTGKLLSFKTVIEDRVESPNHYFLSGHILYSKIRPNLCKLVKVDFEGLCSADMYPIVSLIDRDFLVKYMLSNFFLDQAVKKDTRVAMPKINQEELSKIIVPLPPLVEQRRIVAKVDQLMALCDELEARLRQAQEEAGRLLGALAAAVAAA